MNKKGIVFRMLLILMISVVLAGAAGYGALALMAHFELQDGLAFVGILYTTLMVVAIMCPACKYCPKGMDLLKRR